MSATSVVVWRANEPTEIGHVTQQGDGQRVALLKNWRDAHGPKSKDGEFQEPTELREQGLDRQDMTQDGEDIYEFDEPRLPPATKSDMSYTKGMDMQARKKPEHTKDQASDH